MKALVLFVAVCAAAFTGYHLDLTCCGERTRAEKWPSPIPALKSQPEAKATATASVDPGKEVAEALAQAPR